MKLILFLLLTSCAPVGQPACTPQPPIAEAPKCPEPVDKVLYYRCGKFAECGMWCRVTEECKAIIKEMGE